MNVTTDNATQFELHLNMSATSGLTAGMPSRRELAEREACR